MALIYHVASTADWDQAQRVGEYRISTRGRTLEDVGFIHACQPSQVEPVANSFYKDAGDLFLLVIDTDRVRSEVRYDHVGGWADPFPHIYGPLNTDAVVEVRKFSPGPDGLFTFLESSPS
ncbi:MAG TPA: DUF952 domain-containing protein [Chloroflexota bacterium]